MDQEAANYDPRYLAGILFFNRHDFFEAHEVWEDLWADTPGEDRRFYQALIQAAVVLYHLGNGNWRGARKLYHSSLNYMKPYGSSYRGLDTDQFWREMQQCLAEVLVEGEPKQRVHLDESLIPRLRLDPPPAAWPDPTEFIEQED
jgi:predicted metal-dependent hydrolase